MRVDDGRVCWTLLPMPTHGRFRSGEGNEQRQSDGIIHRYIDRVKIPMKITNADIGPKVGPQWPNVL